MLQAWSDTRTADELAEVEMFAEVLGTALLARSGVTSSTICRVGITRLLRDGGAVAMLAALDAVREVAGRGESRALALEAFVWALTREDAATPHADAAASFDSGDDEERVGADASLLERVARVREEMAAAAADGVDPVEEELARRDAAALRSLASRHALEFADGDVVARPRPPCVPGEVTHGAST